MNRFARRSILLSIAGIVGLAGAPLPSLPRRPMRRRPSNPSGSGGPGRNVRALQDPGDPGARGRDQPSTRGRAHVRPVEHRLPDATDTWLKSTGHTVFLSIKTRRADGSYLKWSAIAAAEPGSALYQDMVRWADAIKAYAVPVYVSFNHEPKTSVSHPSGYRGGIRPGLAPVRRGLPGARRVQCPVRLGRGDPQLLGVQDSYKYAPQYYPGDGWVDVLAIDAYNTYCPKKNGTFTDPWRTLETILAPFMAFAATHPTLELVVAEFGSAEDPAQPDGRRSGSTRPGCCSRSRRTSGSAWSRTGTRSTGTTRPATSG